MRSLLWVGFNVDVGVGVFLTIPKACANLRRDTTRRKIEWSLSKMLDYAASIPLDCPDLTKQTRKTAFLHSLASAARISELHAFGRGSEYITFNEDGSASVAMIRSFVAKNESPVNQWAPFEIPPLP